MTTRPRPAGKGDRTPRKGKPRGQRRLFVFDDLRLPRVWMTGPRWRRAFQVRPACHVRYFRDELTGRRYVVRGPQRMQLLVYSFEDDVRELVMGQREIRPGVFAEWWDPREEIGA